MKDIIIDTDPGHDDALAIMLAVKSNKFKIHAITTVSGNSIIENTTRNARFTLRLLEREDIPVYSGSEKPLKRELVQAVVHGKSGFEGLDPKNEACLTGNAADKIIEIVKNNPGKITIITLGPLTNIAKAILKDPETMSKVERIAIMGGAINVHGNQRNVSEFNMFVDPEAADIVFGFNIKKRLTTLDACNHILLQLEDFNKLKGSALYEPIISLMKPYIKKILDDQKVAGALMYDPLTVYELLNPEACEYKIYNIKVDKDGENSRGKIIAILKDKYDNPRDTKVIMKISEDSFKKDFIGILK